VKWYTQMGEKQKVVICLGRMKKARPTSTAFMCAFFMCAFFMRACFRDDPTFNRPSQDLNSILLLCRNRIFHTEDIVCASTGGFMISEQTIPLGGDLSCPFPSFLEGVHPLTIHAPKSFCLRKQREWTTSTAVTLAEPAERYFLQSWPLTTIRTRCPR
jgi:hypothetical protein